VLPFGLPAGIVTAAIGAPYLIWLLLRSKRKVSV
jgi:iron complex transport system permease protein